VGRSFIWVAAGGAIGASARHALNLAALRLLPPSFPWGTFIVNLVGCFLFGVVAGVAGSRALIGPDARAFLLVGVLGGFTTYSSFAFESMDLIRAGQTAAAFANIGGHILLGLLAVSLGLIVTR
jgi:CrcB protein